MKSPAEVEYFLIPPTETKQRNYRERSVQKIRQIHKNLYEHIRNLEDLYKEGSDEGDGTEEVMQQSSTRVGPFSSFLSTCHSAASELDVTIKEEHQILESLYQWYWKELQLLEQVNEETILGASSPASPDILDERIAKMTHIFHKLDTLKTQLHNLLKVSPPGKKEPKDVPSEIGKKSNNSKVYVATSLKSVSNDASRKKDNAVLELQQTASKKDSYSHEVVEKIIDEAQTKINLQASEYQKLKKEHEDTKQKYARMKAEYQALLEQKITTEKELMEVKKSKVLDSYTEEQIKVEDTDVNSVLAPAPANLQADRGLFINSDPQQKPAFQTKDSSKQSINAMPTSSDKLSEKPQNIPTEEVLKNNLANEKVFASSEHIPSSHINSVQVPVTAEIREMHSVLQASESIDHQLMPLDNDRTTNVSSVTLNTTQVPSEDRADSKLHQISIDSKSQQVLVEKAQMSTVSVTTKAPMPVSPSITVERSQEQNGESENWSIIFNDPQTTKSADDVMETQTTIPLGTRKTVSFPALRKSTPTSFFRDEEILRDPWSMICPPVTPRQAPILLGSEEEHPLLATYRFAESTRDHLLPGCPDIRMQYSSRHLCSRFSETVKTKQQFVPCDGESMACMSFRSGIWQMDFLKSSHNLLKIQGKNIELRPRPIGKKNPDPRITVKFDPSCIAARTLDLFSGNSPMGCSITPLFLINGVEKDLGTFYRSTPLIQRDRSVFSTFKPLRKNQGAQHSKIKRRPS